MTVTIGGRVLVVGLVVDVGAARFAMIMSVSLTATFSTSKPNSTARMLGGVRVELELMFTPVMPS